MIANEKPVLVINSGSSSIKFCLYNMDREALLISGTIEQIGAINNQLVTHEYSTDSKMDTHIQSVHISDHAAGLEQMFEVLQKSGSRQLLKSLYAVGHRVVHGGKTYQESTLIDTDVIEGIREMIPLAPLHNPANLSGIEATRKHYPGVPQVAVFDTAFFHTLPPHACHYALPDNLYRQHHVRRYGFHGISHQQAARESADIMQQPLDTLRLIILHLGNGASAAAIRDGVCIDTSMGMTPLEGLIMGTRCGDLDPSIPVYLARTMGMTVDEIETLLNHDSGLKGLCGTNDMRDVHRLANNGNKQALLALDMYCYRIAKYVGAYYIALGGLDALVFTAGIGENDPLIRQAVCEKLSALGITIEDQHNQASTGEARDIGGSNSKARVLVIPANEELEIARQTVIAVRKKAPE